MLAVGQQPLRRYPTFPVFLFFYPQLPCLVASRDGSLQSLPHHIISYTPRSVPGCVGGKRNSHQGETPFFFPTSEETLYLLFDKVSTFLLKIVHDDSYLQIKHHRPFNTSAVPSFRTNLTVSQSENMVSKSFVSYFLTFLTDPTFPCWSVFRSSESYANISTI
jgi:hypothetical protein